MTEQSGRAIAPTVREIDNLRAENERMRAAIRRVSALTVEWKEEADDDQRHYSSPKVGESEAQTLPALIGRNREHVEDIRAALAGDR